MERLEKSEFGDGEGLPTFGVTPKTEFPTFGNEGNESTLVHLNGLMLIAHVGRGGVGWRQIGDFLIVLYAVAKDRALPVASFVVERRETGLESVVTSIPSPYHNDR